MYSSTAFILFTFLSIISEVFSENKTVINICRSEGINKRVLNINPKTFEVKLAFNLGESLFGMIGTLTLIDGQQFNVTVRMRFNMGNHIDFEPYFWELNEWPINISESSGSKIVTAFSSMNKILKNQNSNKLLFAIYENGKVEAIDINSTDFEVKQRMKVYDRNSAQQTDESGSLHVRHLLRHFPKGIDIHSITMFEALGKTYAFVYTSENFENEVFLVKHIMVGTATKLDDKTVKNGWKLDEKNGYCEVINTSISAVSYAFIRDHKSGKNEDEGVVIKLIEFYGNTYKDFNIIIDRNGIINDENARKAKEKNNTQLLFCDIHYNDYTFEDKPCDDYKQIPSEDYDYYDQYLQSINSESPSDASYVWLWIVIFVVIIILLCLIGLGFYYYIKSMSANKQSISTGEKIQPNEQNIEKLNN